jgi:hypothetical protein
VAYKEGISHTICMGSSPFDGHSGGNVSARVL